MYFWSLSCLFQVIPLAFYQPFKTYLNLFDFHIFSLCSFNEKN